MAAIVTSWIARVFSLAWLTGPIFDKEMRVSSRRRRNYVLRFLYIMLFACLLAMAWAETASYRGSSAYQISRMARAGQAVVSVVLWFEFLAAQAIAVVMLSTSISDEIYHRTLGVLMTTPIGAFQIVLGKLLSKLLQLVLLLAISLPLLAIVRVFGGVPWGLLVGGLCVTLTTALFVGSLSLLFSIFTRRAYSVILAATLAAGVLFALLPSLVAFAACYPNDPSPAFLRVLSYANPYAVMMALTAWLFGAPPIGVGRWPAHCGIMLAASGLLLSLAMALVRKAALRQAMGQTGMWSGRAARNPQTCMAGGDVRRVVGPPVLWRECRLPLLGKRRMLNLVAAIAVIGLLGLTYVLCYTHGVLGDRETQVMYMVVFFAVGMLFTTVLPATCITSEKESQTWPLLLTTSVSEGEILAGKFGGVLRRCAPAWLLLFAHVAVFTVGGIIHPLALLQLGLVVAWVLLFLGGTGLCFGLWLKHTTAAVIANMGVAAGLWAILPLLLALMIGITRVNGDGFELYMDMNPFVQAGVVAMATTHEGSLAGYEWVEGGTSGAVDATIRIVLMGLLHAAVGVVLATSLGSQMRRHPL